MALMSALKQIASIEAGPVSDALKTELFKLVLGTISLPINVPGTNYHQGFKVAFFTVFAKKKNFFTLSNLLTEQDMDWFLLQRQGRSL